MLVPMVPFPVNPRLAGFPNMQVSSGAAAMVIGTAYHQDELSKWAQQFAPIDNSSEAVKNPDSRYFFVQLAEFKDTAAVFIESDFVGVIAKQYRDKFKSSIAWLKENRFPAVAEAYLVGSPWVKYGIRLRTNGSVIEKLIKPKPTDFFQPDLVFDPPSVSDLKNMVINTAWSATSGGIKVMVV